MSMFFYSSHQRGYKCMIHEDDHRSVVFSELTSSVPVFFIDHGSEKKKSRKGDEAIKTQITARNACSII